MSKVCIACGMPMQKAEDFALGDESKDWCRYCARPDGSLRSYNEAIEGMSRFIVETQGLDEEVARRTAASMMAKLPAWQDRDAE